MKLSDIITLLKNTPKTNDKKKILASHADNKALKLLLQMTYDNQYTYWIKATVPAKSGAGVLTWEILNEVLCYLHGRIVTGNAARDYLETVLSNLEPAEQQVLVNCINRDMDCKVSESLINATWKDLIYSFPVMLAGKFNEKTAKPFYAVEPKDITKLGIPQLVVQLKADGGRMEYVAGTGGFSRSGSALKLYDVFSFLDKAAEGFVLDGELVTIDEFGKIQDRKFSNGIYTKAVRNTISKAEAQALHFIVWDIIPVAEFWSGKGTEEYRQRLTKLMHLVSTLKQHSKNISLINTKIIHYVSEAEVFYKQMLDEGEEGAMLKLLSSKWTDERSKSVLKLKEERDATLFCYGTTPHSKNPKWIGSLECRTSDGELEVSIGSGLTEADREKDPSVFINSLIDMKYNQLIKAKGATKWCMFLPIFKAIRVDVTEADTLKHLQ